MDSPPQITQVRLEYVEDDDYFRAALITEEDGRLEIDNRLGSWTTTPGADGKRKELPTAVASLVAEKVARHPVEVERRRLRRKADEEAKVARKQNS